MIDFFWVKSPISNLEGVMMNRLEPLDEKRMQEIALMFHMAMALHEASFLDAEQLQYAEEHFDTWDNRNSAVVLSKKLGITVEEATRFLATTHSKAISTAKENLARKIA